MSLIEPITQYLHGLAVAILVGKVVLLSFVVAPVLAKQWAPEQFGNVVRQLFPAYYLLGIGRGCWWFGVGDRTPGHSWVQPGPVGGGRHLADDFPGGILLPVPLTPQSNAMRDRLKEQERQGCVDPVLKASWERLHQRSLYLNSLVLFGGLWLVGLAY